MSYYYAKGENGIAIPKEGFADKVAEILVDYFNDVVIIDERVCFCLFYGTYNDTEALEVLETLNPYILEGEIEFSGEGRFWKFYYDESLNKWESISGDE